MPEVHFSREEVREIALGQQEADALQAAVDAFNGLLGCLAVPGW
jgi:hypothetical protein